MSPAARRLPNSGSLRLITFNAERSPGAVLLPGDKGGLLYS